MTADDVAAIEETEPARRSQRTTLTVLGLVAAVLLGFAIGFLARIPLEDKETPTPADDSVDVGFLQDMTVHHIQAVTMATYALKGATDPAVQSLAFDILTTQQTQIGEMQGLLTLWEKPLLPPPGEGYMAWMTDSDHGHDMPGMDMGSHSGPVDKMPGMASDEELKALRQAQGPAFDTLFLQLMLRHHQGGASMLAYAADHAEVDAVRNLARAMLATQDKESAQITEMITQRGAQPLPMN
ncbi:DUF305 domain-containing protein [Antrihabitans sp. YC2-6]|uniref:DUF305 domain-containing protein n=1 Tax=Antrihabitans sp. YC2-6 TaxID=2799498 RepID=UPI0018F5988A|nr:DUF305 domain-containing protein [Antrihabitans sp. YC2-6]MBJ8348191.1 DUF305 domain-containing protein [Antrihabitans sp. YC2-6]